MGCLLDLSPQREALANGRAPEDVPEDPVFAQAFIPHTLMEVDRYEEDTLALARNQAVPEQACMPRSHPPLRATL